MHFIIIITALVATIVPALGAAIDLTPRSDQPCRPEEEGDLRCNAFDIEICEQRNGRRYWNTFRQCGISEICVEIAQGDPRCRPYIMDCYPWCNKAANGTVNDTAIEESQKEEN